MTMSNSESRKRAAEAMHDVDGWNTGPDAETVPDWGYAEWEEAKQAHDTWAATRAEEARGWAMALENAFFEGWMKARGHSDNASDYTGCGVWDGQPGSGYCCDRPVGHSGPHHASHFWEADHD